MPVPPIIAKDESNTTVLPSPLQDNTPICAQACVSSYISQQFDCVSNDFGCLCSHYSTTGYTLGELAYGCLQVSCSEPSASLQRALYDICDTQPAAAAPTHSNLTLPSTTAPALSQSATVASTASASTSFSSSQLTAAPSSSPSVTNSTTDTSHTSGLTTSQAIGISAGAFGALVVAGIVVFVIFCIRNRKMRWQLQKVGKNSYDFIDEGPPKHHQLNTRTLNDAHLVSANPQDSWYQQHLQQASQPLVKEIRYDAYSNRKSSAESTRTISQLLPDKPLPSTPSRSQAYHAVNPVVTFDSISPRSQAVSRPAPAYSGAYQGDVYDDQRQPPLSIDIPRLAARTPPSTLSGELLPPVEFGTPLHQKMSKMRTQAAGLQIRTTPCPDQTLQKPSNRQTPEMAHRSASSLEYGQSAYAQPMPVVPRTTTASPRVGRRSPHGHHESRLSIDTKTPPRQTTETRAELKSPARTPIEDVQQKRRPVPASIKVPAKVCPDRAYRPDYDSDTSFEDSDEEKEIAIQPRPAPAVSKSPVNYPTVPQSRSPTYHQQSRSPAPHSHPARGASLVNSNHDMMDREVERYDSPMSSTGRKYSASQPSPARYAASQPSPSYSQHSGYSHRPSVPKLPNVAAYDTYTAPRDNHGYTRQPSIPQLPKAATFDAYTAPQRQQQTRQMQKNESPLRGYGSSVDSRPMGLPSNPRLPRNTPSPADQRLRNGLPSNPRDVRTQDVRPQHDRTMALRSPSTPNIRKQEVASRDDGWEQKLTPTRRGDDLYLNVNMATPGFVPESSWPMAR